MLSALEKGGAVGFIECLEQGNRGFALWVILVFCRDLRAQPSGG